MHELVRAAVSGALATAAMSSVMALGEWAGLMSEQPPKHIVRAAMPGAKHRPKRGEGALGTLAHFGFGIGCGTLLHVLARGRHVRQPVAVGYALSIWIASYEGWVPRMGVLPPISRDQPGRPIVMAAAHAIYGITLAYALNRLRRR
ncbi:DUF6789 family protein [Nonomuraea sp. NPDC046802]|uniref:DUF6789 family protein n=1 Tax=Nonomuraea sp. NPDC046802 TaxID=3154919 RepID=UPI0033F37B2E